MTSIASPWVSIDGTGWARIHLHRAPTANARNLLLILGHHMNHDGECWPGIKYLCRQLGDLSRRSVTRLLSLLRKEGLIDCLMGKGRTTTHYFAVDWKGEKRQPQSPPQSAPQSPLSTKNETRQPDLWNDAVCHPREDSRVLSERTRESPKETREQTREQINESLIHDSGDSYQKKRGAVQRARESGKRPEDAMSQSRDTPNRPATPDGPPQDFFDRERDRQRDDEDPGGFDDEPNLDNPPDWSGIPQIEPDESWTSRNWERSLALADVWLASDTARPSRGPKPPAPEERQASAPARREPAPVSRDPVAEETDRNRQAFATWAKLEPFERLRAPNTFPLTPRTMLAIWNHVVREDPDSTIPRAIRLDPRTERNLKRLAEKLCEGKVRIWTRICAAITADLWCHGKRPRAGYENWVATLTWASREDVAIRYLEKIENQILDARAEAERQHRTLGPDLDLVLRKEPMDTPAMVVRPNQPPPDGVLTEEEIASLPTLQWWDIQGLGFSDLLGLPTGDPRIDRETVKRAVAILAAMGRLPPKVWRSPAGRKFRWC